MSLAYEIYDFRRPTTLAREQSRVLELAFETFTRQWSTQLTAKTRVRSHVAFGGVGIRTYDDYATGLPPQTAMMLLEISASTTDGKGVIQFPAAAALGWITRMLGGGNEPIGDGAAEWAPPERAFTQIEQGLVRRLVDDTIDDLRYSFGARLPGEVVVDSIQHNSQFAQAAAPSDLMIVASFEVTVADRVDVATIAIPTDAVLPAIAGAQPKQQREESQLLLRSQLAAVPVDVALQLAPLEITAPSVISLAVGDIIRLPHPSHKPLNVAVDGRTVARASVGTTGSRLACVVVDTEESAR